MLLYIFLQQGSAIEIVDRNVEEALVLGIVQVHGDDMVGAGTGEKVCDQSAGLGDPLLVAGAWFEGIRGRVELGRLLDGEVVIGDTVCRSSGVGTSPGTACKVF